MLAIAGKIRIGGTTACQAPAVSDVSSPMSEETVAVSHAAFQRRCRLKLCPTKRVEAACLVGEPPRQLPGELFSIPILHLYAGQLKALRRQLNDVSTSGAGARKSGFLDYANSLFGEITVWIGEAGHRMVQDLLQ